MKSQRQDGVIVKNVSVAGALSHLHADTKEDLYMEEISEVKIILHSIIRAKILLKVILTANKLIPENLVTVR